MKNIHNATSIEYQGLLLKKFDIDILDKFIQTKYMNVVIDRILLANVIFSRSALFIKTKNHVRVCPLLKTPYKYTFYFC